MRRALVLQPYLVESARFPGRQPPILALQRRRRPAQVASTAKKQGLGSHHWLTEVVVLGRQLDRDLAGAFGRCRDLIVAIDVWYGPDILGERVSGPALVSDFEPALALLAPWREDANRWVRRAVGISAHFWAKRSRGEEEYTAQAESLLAFLDPMFEEWDMDVVKGVGWGLKTLGQYYPHLLTNWLVEQVVHRQRHHRALMLRKPLTYLSEEQRARVARDAT